MKSLFFLFLVVLFGPFVSRHAAQSRPVPSAYLFVWAGDSDGKDSDFLAVIDARPEASTYGEIVASLPVGATGTFPHHTEYEFPLNSQLFANGWGAGQTFIVDLADPRKPKLVRQFKDLAEYGFPHSYARLPNGNVLATFQVKKAGYEPPGALVEFDAEGKLIRTASSDITGADKKQLWPYSLLVLPEKKLVVTTNTEMGLPKWAMEKGHGGSHETHTLSDTNMIQVWRLPELRLWSTFMLPSPRGGKSNLNPAEPRLLSDGSVYVNTFNCGLFRLAGIEGAVPRAEHVFDFPGAGTKEECGVPVVVGKYWIQTDPTVPGLVVLDTSDPAKPIEVSRLVLEERFKKVHWIAADRSAHRVVITGNNQSWVLIANIDMKTGKLTVDEKFKSKLSDYTGIDFDRPRWPHGESGKAFVHGALFGPQRGEPLTRTN
jgi:hypothetical protein